MFGHLHLHLDNLLNRNLLDYLNWLIDYFLDNLRRLGFFQCEHLSQGSKFQFQFVAIALQVSDLPLKFACFSVCFALEL